MYQWYESVQKSVEMNPRIISLLCSLIAFRAILDIQFYSELKTEQKPYNVYTSVIRYIESVDDKTSWHFNRVGIYFEPKLREFRILNHLTDFIVSFL